MTATSTPMIEWLNDTDIDPEWIRRHMPSSQFETTVKASVVDMSNQGRKGARPRDGATLLLTLTMSSSSSSSNEQEEDEEETPKTKTLVIKQVPDSGLALSKQLGLAREAFFFTDLAPKIGTSTTTTTASSSSSSSSSTSLSIPTVYYAYGDMDCGTKVVIMEDLSDGYIDSGILFGPGNPNNWNRDLPNLIADAYNNVDNKVPTSFEVANRTFLSIAQVHATFWNDETLLEPSKTSYLRGAHWINGDHKESWQASQGLIQNMWKSINSDNDNTTTSNDSSDTKTKKKTVDERIRWDPLVKEVLQTAMDGISWEAQTERLNRSTHWTLVHGDFWPGNVMVSTKDVTELRLLDWEMVGVGSGPQDLGQYVLSNMDPKDRRDCEQRLVRNYYDELMSLGVSPDFTFDECWKEYTTGGLERWLWFLVYFVANDSMLDWAQFFHDQIAAFVKDHDITPNDVTQPRP